ncbi:helix-turn-helix domain-containing protein [Streptacidiphilus griseoplanus]|uniref:helix-turn-helix domain-containing protein n=1 Tax=Peterkaempfera griseoplana TaxID=66896 RepID=UPI001FE12BEF|nr:helix-turn-helix domain-containing protein [Peterkaempfera griseoplana]
MLRLTGVRAWAPASLATTSPCASGRRNGESVLNARVARETGLHLDTVRCWRGRFAEHGLHGLTDRKRSGRPPSFTAPQVAEAKALACWLPAETGAPVSRWSCPELARELAARGITGTASASAVRRWPAEDALKPWQHHSWNFITDPDFRPKAARVLGLYARTWQAGRSARTKRPPSRPAAAATPPSHPARPGPCA